MMPVNRGRRGVALLEVLAASTILFIAVAGWLALMSELRHMTAAAERRELEVRRAASALSIAMSMPVDSLLSGGADRLILGFHVTATRRSFRTLSITVSDASSRTVVLESVVRTPSGGFP